MTKYHTTTQGLKAVLKMTERWLLWAQMSMCGFSFIKRPWSNYKIRRTEMCQCASEVFDGWFVSIFPWPVCAGGKGCVTPSAVTVDQLHICWVSTPLEFVFACPWILISFLASVPVRPIRVVPICHLSRLMDVFIKCFPQWAHVGSAKDTERSDNWHHIGVCFLWQELLGCIKEKANLCPLKDKRWQYGRENLCVFSVYLEPFPVQFVRF